MENILFPRSQSASSSGSRVQFLEAAERAQNELEKEFPRVSSQVPLSPRGDEDDRSYQYSEAEVERGTWTGKFDFLLSLLGYSVGLGNVWRFPYLCYSNGGGAFLIPFICMMLLAGLPLMFMELSFGQYASLGPIAIFDRFCPLFTGLGYGMVIVSGTVMLYYNMIIAWTIFYMFASWNSQLPWEHCKPEWSTPACYSHSDAQDCMSKNGTYYNRTCFDANYTLAHNLSFLIKNMTKKPPADEYFVHYVLGESSGIEETGGIRWSLAACLVLAWVIVFLCLSKGVQSSGKVVYFTALFPYVVLVILFFRGVTLPGAKNGILFYVTPDWSRLATAQVWGDAAVQIFFALSPAWGGLITLSSYNKFHNNCYKDSLIVSISNVLTSIFAGFVIFSVIGYLAHELNVEVGKVVDEGAGLAFIVYPEVVARLPVAPLWAFLFFFMLLTLGLDSQFALLETVTTAILDRFPTLREKKTWVVFFLSLMGYCGGIIFTTNAGVFWLELFDKYAANFSVLIIAICECLLISWNYGAEKFLRDIEKMIGVKSHAWMVFWSIMWRVLTPATLVFILVFNWIEYKPAKSGNYVFPDWANVVGWVIAFFPVVVIVFLMFYKICTTTKRPFREKLSLLMQPTDEWGPPPKLATFKTGDPSEDASSEYIRKNSFDNPSFNVTYTFETAI
ncbi:sodium- and chloride-dependent glycine transporter 1-like isoform X3 [Argiope bruennichi]|uniref:sodium- and chloride-dependent glycine transporter 1-like isoform X3 n=1 Tax=Argiope bruennichi TaxID=94029 RepID=UPI002494934C|nr:sodium- and chloride-dependent glycine transporter 1-like isoform X3 [Argiope bruennichi]